ncbi:54S ribosomal protein L17, mitochondrial [Vanrija pseudolonga]|uniref:54S ribosomal protein L17, mitochondrial n=1 Tax=Vanrija pseudolonga TaxID=143232 RepID=A0AAF0Y7Z8_9TREE|nr:54S ribosomal protein L17, mitochondrial [Vanrija pseudolonga]
MPITMAASGTSRQALRRGLATAAASSSTSAPALTASVLISRAPLLTPTPHPMAKAYWERSSKLRHAFSNPTNTSFYFKQGSLPLRRFLESQYETERGYYGEQIAGKKPELGEVQPEPELVELDRDHWAKADAERGDRSLERAPEEEIYLVVESKGKWTFPSTPLKTGEALDEAVTSRIVGVDGSLGGQTLDTWLVTKKPVGVVVNGEARNFFLRSHILAGEPKLSKDSGYKTHAWLTAPEVEARLRKQGDDKIWESVKGMFGVGEEEI